MEKMLEKVFEICVEAGSRLLLALAVFLIGRFVVRKLLKLLGKGRGFAKLEPTVARFLMSFVRAALYVILAVSIVGILGVPLASIITMLASAGVAIGLALQGALGNLAGGLMLLVFKPFAVGDYVSAAGAEGTVREISLFYTVLISVDNKRITIPNGSLMNANVTNFTSEDLRRVDISFNCAKDEDIGRVQKLMMEVMEKDERILKEPAPFARISGGSDNANTFTARAWVKSAAYWDVYHDLIQGISEAMKKEGVHTPALRFVNE